MMAGLVDCPNCSGKISGNITHCPWCDAQILTDTQLAARQAPWRRKVSIGAYMTIMTLAALLIWLAMLTAQSIEQ